MAGDPLGAVGDLAPYLPGAKRLAVFHPGSHLTEPDTWQEVRSAVRGAGFSGELLAGVRSHFTEASSRWTGPDGPLVPPRGVPITGHPAGRGNWHQEFRRPTVEDPFLLAVANL